MDEPFPTQILDEKGLRALTHPLRLQLLGLLRQEGAATATLLATRTGQSSGLTSYHLRQLADAGLVTEVARGTGRERWWQPVARSHTFTPRDADPELGEQYQRTVVHRLAEQALRWVDASRAWPQDWRDVAGLSDFRLDLNAGQAEALLTELVATIDRYTGLPAEPDAQQVSLQLNLFPTGEPQDQS